MAPRKQAKQAAAESTQVAAADGNVTPPKKRKAAANSTVPKQAKAAAPRQVRQVKEQQAATVFSPKNLRSRQKDVAPKNDAENKSKKMFVNKQKEEEKTVEDDNTGEQVEKKTRGGGKSAATKKAGTKTATAKPKAKAPVVKKKKDQVENGAGDVENGIVSDENPPKRTTRRGKAADEENVAPAATKVRVIKRPRKRKTAETEAIAEADDEELPEKNDAEMIVDNKKSREKAKKTAKTPVKKEKSKKNSTKTELALSEKAEIEEQNGQNTEIDESKPKNSKKGSVKKVISKGKRNAEKEIKDVEKEEGISMNLALESVDENDASIDKSNNVSHNENNEAELTMEMKDDEVNIKDSNAFERSATFVLFE